MSLRTLLFVFAQFAALTGSTLVLAEESTQPDAHKTYLVLNRPGPNWDESKRVWKQALGGHKDYLIDRYEEGVLKLAGPFTDDWGGGVLVQVADAQAATVIAENDPAVVNGVFIFEIHPWFLVNWDEALEQRKSVAANGSNPE